MAATYHDDEKLRVFVLFSGGASAGLGLIDGPNFTRRYKVVGAGTNEPEASGIGEFRKRGIDPAVFDYKKFLGQYNLKPGRKANEGYHDQWLEKIRTIDPHVIVLSGYFRIVPRLFLDEYPDTKNVHPAPLHYITRVLKDGGFQYGEIIDAAQWTQKQAGELLAQRTLEGKPVYIKPFTGEKAVFDLALFGQSQGISQLRATVHRAVPEVDNGPIEVESACLEIDREKTGKLIRNRSWSQLWDYTNELQNRLKVEGDIPAMRKAVELTAERRLVHTGGSVFVDTEELPYCGLQLPDSERVLYDTPD
ncbi:MAG: hypothetical protein HY518_04565 [Candidatus Aenigmarchaeota archaeon]|nr:hypothetical protein [Candidatus Aenigmarchaeota archaeon]